jgi:hypothetical protein
MLKLLQILQLDVETVANASRDGIEIPKFVRISHSIKCLCADHFTKLAQIAYKKGVYIN